MAEENETVEPETETNEEQMVTLPLAKFKERLERAKRQVRREYGDIEPQTLEEMRRALANHDNEKEQWNHEREEYSGRVESMSGDLQKLEAERNREIVKGELVRQFVAQGGLPSAIDDALNAMLAGDRSSEAALDSATFVKEFLSGRPYFRRIPGASGSGVPGSGAPVARVGNAGARLDSREARLAAARRQLRE